MTTLDRRSYTHSASGHTLPYLHARPTAADANDGGAPLLLFLHGARDRGADLDLLLRWAPPRLVAEAADLPYHFAAPQIPADATWPEHADALLGLIDHLAEDEGIDPAHVVLAGFSLGAAGAWRIASLHPRRFAGLIAVSGRIAPDLDLDALAGLPTWVFHGQRDDKVPPADLEPALTPLSVRNVSLRHTLYPEGNHFIADQAFTEPGLLHWLLSLSNAPAQHPRAEVAGQS